MMITPLSDPPTIPFPCYRQGNVVILSGVPPSMTDVDLCHDLQVFGTILSIDITTDGVAAVTFMSLSSAVMAVESLNDQYQGPIMDSRAPYCMRAETSAHSNGFPNPNDMAIDMHKLSISLRDDGLRILNTPPRTNTQRAVQGLLGASGSRLDHIARPDQQESLQEGLLNRYRKIPVESGYCECGVNTTYTCMRCGKFYCSRDCQSTGWPTHKKECEIRMPALNFAGRRFQKNFDEYNVGANERNAPNQMPKQPRGYSEDFEKGGNRLQITAGPQFVNHPHNNYERPQHDNARFQSGAHGDGQGDRSPQKSNFDRSRFDDNSGRFPSGQRVDGGRQFNNERQRFENSGKFQSRGNFSDSQGNRRTSDQGEDRGGGPRPSNFRNDGNKNGGRDNTNRFAGRHEGGGLLPTPSPEHHRVVPQLNFVKENSAAAPRGARGESVNASPISSPQEMNPPGGANNTTSRSDQRPVNVPPETPPSPAKAAPETPAPVAVASPSRAIAAEKIPPVAAPSKPIAAVTIPPVATPQKEITAVTIPPVSSPSKSIPAVAIPPTTPAPVAGAPTTAAGSPAPAAASPRIAKDAKGVELISGSKVVISYFKDAHLYVRPVDHAHIVMFETLVGALSQLCQSAPALDRPPKKRELVACKYHIDQQYYRAVVEDRVVKSTTKYCVRFIDFGNRDEASNTDMKQLSEQIADVPFMAVKTCLKDIVPIPFNDKATALLSDYFAAEKPLIVEFSGPEGSATIVLKEEDGSSVNEKINNLLQPPAVAPVSRSVNQTAGAVDRITLESMKYAPFPKVGESVDVAIGHIEKGILMCYPLNNEELLQKIQLLHIDLATYGQGSKGPYHPQDDEIVVAQWTDGAFYRGTSFGCQDEQKGYKLLFIDYGNIDVIAPDNIRPIKKEFAEAPALSSMALLNGVALTDQQTEKLMKILETKQPWVEKAVVLESNAEPGTQYLDIPAVTALL